MMPENQAASALYLRKIERRQPLSDKARAAFLALPNRIESFRTYREIVRENEPTGRCCLLVEGFASRFKTLPSGGRQINSFHFPGDMVDLESVLLPVADHGIRTHTATKIATYDGADILNLAAEHPEWSRALWFDTLVDSSIFREWMLNVGRRSALSRIAHLLLEFAWRLEAAGDSDGETFAMPVTQADLADAAGLSVVHTNRSLQRLREDRMIRSIGKTMVIEDRKALVAVAAFDPTYLHPEGPRLLLAA